MGDSSSDASSFEALVALAKALGVPPDQFVEFCQSLEQAAGTPLDQLAAGIAWHMNEEKKKYQDAFDPMAWFQGWFPTAFPSVVEQFSPPPAEEPQQQAA